MSTPQTDTPETDAAKKFIGGGCEAVDVATCEKLERRAIAAEARVKELEAALRLRPIAEAGPVPEGAVRVYSYYSDNYMGWLWSHFPSCDITHFSDIYPPALAEEGQARP
jgi:hypothetical protein